MKPLPETEDSIVLRTDFSDDQAWRALGDEISKPVGGSRAYVQFVDDREYADVASADLVAAFRSHPKHFFLLVADARTFSQGERTLLVLDLWHEPGRAFRVVPGAVQSVENNLSIANMDFEDFSDAVDDDGVFRGF